MNNRVAMALIALAFAGCVQAGAKGDAMTQPQSCGAEAYANLIGQNQSALNGIRFSGPVRVIKPGMAVTMDYDETRLNFRLDAEGVIRAVTCG